MSIFLWESWRAWPRSPRDTRGKKNRWQERSSVAVCRADLKSASYKYDLRHYKEDSMSNDNEYCWNPSGSLQKALCESHTIINSARINIRFKGSSINSRKEQPTRVSGTEKLRFWRMFQSGNQGQMWNNFWEKRGFRVGGKAVHLASCESSSGCLKRKFPEKRTCIFSVFLSESMQCIAVSNFNHRNRERNYRRNGDKSLEINGAR